MKKVTLALIGLLFAAGTIADEATNSDLTLAAVNLGVKTVWVETQEDVEARITEELQETSIALNEKANAQFNDSLEAKLEKAFIE